MADKVTVELSAEYAEHLELLKQIIPSATGEQITDDGKMVEALIDSFMAFIQEQAGAHEHADEGGCCGGGSCGTEEKVHEHEHKHEGGCCSK